MDDPPQAGILAPVAKDSKDCTNNCPDSILSHIVSLLRIEHAVETSVLSRQWRYLWKTRPNLEFDIPNIFGDKYTRLVEKLAQLKTLWLNNVVVDSGFLEHLSSVCVLLEGLTLRKCRVHSNLIIIGPSLHLKDLKVLDCNTLDKIEIDVVNLSSFEFRGNILKISCMTTPLLVRFFFRGCCDLYGLPYAFTLLALCPGLETLQLQLLNKLENISQTVPTFGNLKHLNLDLFTPDFDLWSVLNILKAAPNLEELVITGRSYDYQGEMMDISGFSHNHLRKVKCKRSKVCG
ncbi:hypothetical protein ACLB2K_054176 [Fragaria x ananassa]